MDDQADKKRVSIIIPALNEEASIFVTLKHLEALSPAPYEVIVVDGGSDDKTVEIVHAFAKTSSFPIKVVFSDQGRAKQINKGVHNAKGDIVAFLHADTWLSPDALSVMPNVLSNEKIGLAGFTAIIQGSERTWWMINFHHIIKTYYAPLIFRPHLFFKGARLLFGDQVMFMRRHDFETCGGFDDDMEIMEEANLCLKVVRAGLGRVKLVDRTVVTSDRRIAKWGGFKSTFLHFYIGILWGIGVSPKYLKQFYADFR
ncbi:TIGR04283 family arsenosugar biosynthesis glycosyltransferase [Kordiimonas sp. SCSIO 12610]|uniref:TIGR04283 family arsenosugar biosynthesis glycosyltransferase n=1 Tax=Kordiimonas sp. SCSIO 12610 TaxID=2829597 RepID=UPI002109691F|nr:TIGR04283 family arsenosugar biosynthesis glycosyltransferase [Kordiimonas sp. SCSIO 12610]UTW55142.1 TIGR04283 family arsenosugar biosynthesis glycosyltransferase [Kordiimonas sp. SCSIO 12610]